MMLLGRSQLLVTVLHLTLVLLIARLKLGGLYQLLLLLLLWLWLIADYSILTVIVLRMTLRCSLIRLLYLLIFLASSQACPPLL